MVGDKFYKDLSFVILVKFLGFLWFWVFGDIFFKERIDYCYLYFLL